MAHRKTVNESLANYRAKRDFTKTSEPSGKNKTSKVLYRYLIQKHAARRLHYDFRLEMNGVLKSWAVTRGPSLDPNDKRLAVHVEDHPVAYGGFEGTIPQGQYGGGTVMLWDEGTWLPIGDAEKAYKEGHMDFELQGARLKGRWHLVRMGRKAQDSKHENWLLIKGKDRYANEENGDYALKHFDKSVVSDRGMDDIAQDKPKNSSAKLKTAKKIARSEKSKKASANLSSPPDFIAPQLATLVKAPPLGSGWVHEIKYDGYRLLAHIDGANVRLMTRANNDWTSKFRGLAANLADISLDNAFLDGEAVCVADDGTMSFHGLQQALSDNDMSRIHYYLFDLLFLNGEDWRARPLLERKEKLAFILRNAPANIHYSQHFTEQGEKVLSHACHIALEGIISKRPDAPYHSGRDDLWVKSKCTKEQEAVIGGFTMQPKHPGSLGALLTGHYAKGDLIFSGKVGTGYTHEEGRAIIKKLRSLRRATSPFQNVPALSRKGTTWVQPELVAQIQFAEWTPDGMMRHPSFQGLREDKPARDVKREVPKLLSNKSTRETLKTKVQSPVKQREYDEVAGVKLTHPDKNLYAASHVTKLDLALYYEEVAPLMLAQIAGRPISLLRCPSGEGKPCFFQRHGGDGLSPYIKPVRIPGDKEPYLMIDDVPGLIALAQMGVLEIHVWGCKGNKPGKPDRLVFDLDPGQGVAFANVKEAALTIRDRLKQVRLTSFLKVTGGKGLHVVVPFRTGPSWADAKDFSKKFAELIVKEQPNDFTINNRKDARIGKIYIDYLRNGEGSSAVAPYSTRARKGAPLALPIDWSELKKLASGDEFTLNDFYKRSKKDPWKDIGSIKQKLVGSS